MKKVLSIIAIVTFITLTAIIVFLINYKIDLNSCCSCCQNKNPEQVCIDQCCQCTKRIKRKKIEKM